MTTCLDSNTLHIKDGRALGYAEYGNPSGKPLLYLHGHPSSRLEAGSIDEAANRNNVRVIGIDRPGFGLSSYKSGRHILDWTDDVVEFANDLHLDRFAVVGFSGGGPYALACAKEIPERLTASGIVSGVGRTSPFSSFLSSWMPWLMLPMIRRHFTDAGAAKKAMATFVTRWPEPDQKAYALPHVSDSMVAALVAGLPQDSKGAAYDGTLIGSRDWGFRFEEIVFSQHLLVARRMDNRVPVARARQAVKQLPHCKAAFYPNDAHLSMLVNHVAEIVKTLA